MAQIVYQDASIRTQQIITKVALNPSNVLGYDARPQRDVTAAVAKREKPP